MPTTIPVRVFGGTDVEKKYVSAVQPDPSTLHPGTEVIVFVSAATSIDPGVTASTVEAFYFTDGDQLRRFDGEQAEVSTRDAVQELSRQPSF